LLPSENAADPPCESYDEDDEDDDHESTESRGDGSADYNATVIAGVYDAQLFH
jgi:hypothetical protein